MWHEPTNELRFIERHEPVDGKPLIVQSVKVLQQKWLDGWDVPYWKDVPVIKEEDIDPS